MDKYTLVIHILSDIFMKVSDMVLTDDGGEIIDLEMWFNTVFNELFKEEYCCYSMKGNDFNYTSTGFIGLKDNGPNYLLFTYKKHMSKFAGTLISFDELKKLYEYDYDKIKGMTVNDALSNDDVMKSRFGAIVYFLDEIANENLKMFSDEVVLKKMNTYLEKVNAYTNSQIIEKLICETQDMDNWSFIYNVTGDHKMVYIREIPQNKSLLWYIAGVDLGFNTSVKYDGDKTLLYLECE